MLCDRIKSVKLAHLTRYHIILFIGDAIIIAIVTIIGFASHDTLGTAGFRMLTTFVPVVIAWVLIAPHFRVYDLNIVSQVRDLWRPPWAMVLAAPMAAFLRGAWLRTPIAPIFVVVIGGVNAIAILLWRVIFFLILTKWIAEHG
jgi:hypothetical protein